MADRMAGQREWRTEWSNGGNDRMAGMVDGMVEWQTEMATYVLFTVHTDNDTDDDDDTLIFYSIDDMVLFTSIKIQKKFLKNSQKPKMQKPSNIINNSFWSALYSSSLMISMLKSYPSHVLVLFSDVMDGFGSPFSPHLLVC